MMNPQLPNQLLRIVFNQATVSVTEQDERPSRLIQTLMRVCDESSMRIIRPVLNWGVTWRDGDRSRVMKTRVTTILVTMRKS